MLLSQQHNNIWYGKLQCLAGMNAQMLGRLWLRLQIAHFGNTSSCRPKGVRKTRCSWNVINLGIREEKRCHLQNSTEGTALGWIHHKVGRWCSAACPSHPQDLAIWLAIPMSLCSLVMLCGGSISRIADIFSGTAQMPLGSMSCLRNFTTVCLVESS